MQATRLKLTWALLSIAAAGGCNTPSATSAASDEADDVAAAATPATTKNAAAVETEGASRAEQAHKLLERGGDAAAAKAGFEAALADPKLSQNEQDDARLGLSQACAALGDNEGAISAVEQVLKARGQTPEREAAEKQLRKLLTGTEDEPSSFMETERYAPVARALAPYFTADDKNHTVVDVYQFGVRGSKWSDLGVFNIAAAKRAIARDECALCETNLHVGQSISGAGSWTSIPVATVDTGADMPQIDRSLVVFYFDLDGNRVPSRYDAYLPIPSADIVSHLERGEGLIAMRERPGAKPTIVIAAPRVGQLPAVEEAFAKLTALPKTPLVVPIASGLTGDEVQSAVRGGLSSARKCYQASLSKDPTATGSVSVEFTVEGDGTVSGARIDDGPSTLKDTDLDACLVDSAMHLSFPKSGSKTTVRYPYSFRPTSK